MKKTDCVLSKTFRLLFLSAIIFCYTFPIKSGVSHHDRKRATASIEVKETSRIIYPLDIENVTGCIVSRRTRKPLPVGATLDNKHGIFYWHPGPGFIGRYKFLFISKNGNDNNNGKSIDNAFHTISHAFDLVKPGETIQILAGTYYIGIVLENLGNSCAAITLKGEADSTILDGQRTRSLGIWCENCTNLIFENLEIRNYTDIGIGALSSSTITLRNLSVHNNGSAAQLTDWELEGYGINADECSNVMIENNDVYQNGPNPQTDILMGTGINTFGCTDSTIRNNQCYENIGGGILVEDGVNVLVEGNNVYNNDLDASIDEWWDGGLWVDGGHDIIIRNNTFTGNLGPGIEFSDEDFQNPYGYILENNTSTGNYYGIFIWNFGTNDWPPNNIIQRSGNQFTGNSIKNIWITSWY